MRRYQLTTPDQVSFHYQVAGLVTRALAVAIDSSIMILIIAGAIWICVQLAPISPVISIVIIFLAIFFIIVGYFIFFESVMHGQTPGKKIMRLRVMSATGGQLNVVEILIRNLVRPVDTLPAFLMPAFMLVGGIAASIDRWHRRLGDMAANTLVIRDFKPHLPQSVVRHQSRHNTFYLDPVLRTRIMENISREERDLIMDLVMRRDELDLTAREELFAGAARCCARRLKLPDKLEHLSDEQMVINVALVLQDGWFRA